MTDGTPTTDQPPCPMCDGTGEVACIGPDGEYDGMELCSCQQTQSPDVVIDTTPF